MRNSWIKFNQPFKIIFNITLNYILPLLHAFPFGLIEILRLLRGSASIAMW